MGWGMGEVFGFMVVKVGFSTSCVGLDGRRSRVWLRLVGIGLLSVN